MFSRVWLVQAEQQLSSIPTISRSGSSFSQGAITSTQATIERQLKAINNLAADIGKLHSDSDLSVEQRDQDSDLRLLQTATGDRNSIISRISQRSARCFQQYRDARGNLEALKEKHKARVVLKVVAFE